MQKIGKIKIIFVLAVALCFTMVLVVLTGATTAPQGMKKPKAKKVKTDPIWQITQEGTARSIKWVIHSPNPRFAFYDPIGDSDGGGNFFADDLVLDRETGLVWARDLNTGQKTWQFAVNYCRNLKLGNRKGWRLPTVEELATLIDPQESMPALPNGHPFRYVITKVWSSTTYESDNTQAWQVSTVDGEVLNEFKWKNRNMWPVRGGTGYASGNW